MAGKFESVFNVKNIEGFVSAVNKVIASYDNEDENNQILVQPMFFSPIANRKIKNRQNPSIFHFSIQHT